MRSPIVRSVAAAAAAVAIGTSVFVAPAVNRSPSGGGGGGSTANVWVDGNGGTCTRAGTAAVYVDAAACSTFDAAWDAASASDTIRVKAGTYGQQTITGDKASQTSIIGEDGTVISGASAFCNGTGGIGDSLFCAKAAKMTLQNVTINTGVTDHDQAGAFQIMAANVAFRTVNLYGTFVAGYCDGPQGASAFSWVGGKIGEDGTVGGQRVVPGGEPIWLEGCSATIDGIKINPQDADTVTDFHLENIRVQGSSNVTIQNVWFVDSPSQPGGGVGSGNIFVSGTPINNLVVRNNFFGSTEGGTDFQVSPTVTSCSAWVVAYNTFTKATGTGNCASITWTGNLGPFVSCGTKNVWQRATDPGCGSDTWVSGTSSASDQLGFDTAGHLQVGSVAIDAAETGSGADYCVNALGSVDFEGTVRPQGAKCDAGSDER